jgi:peptidoglycan/xylan/chitin deacetylase (PgdA/CDA1 family)
VLTSVPPRLWQQVFPKDVIGLTYHVVSDEDLPHMKNYAYKNVQRFAADLAYIQSEHRFVSYDELVHYRLKRAPVSPSGVFLTLDDGLAECFTVIRPVLHKYGVGAAFFVTTNLIDNKMMFIEHAISLCIGAVERLSDQQASELVGVLDAEQILQDSNRRGALNYGMARFRRARIEKPATASHRSLIILLLMLGKQDEDLVGECCDQLGIDEGPYLRQHPLCLTSAQVRQLSAEGFTIGAHGLTHTNLRLMSSPTQMEFEISGSCDMIRQLTGQKRVSFAFPYTGKGLGVGFLADLLRRYDFIELFFDTGGLRRSPEFVVNRVWADQPRGRIREESNLPYLLSEAWAEAEVWSRSGSSTDRGRMK